MKRIFFFCLVFVFCASLAAGQGGSYSQQHGGDGGPYGRAALSPEIFKNQGVAWAYNSGACQAAPGNPYLFVENFETPGACLSWTPTLGAGGAYAYHLYTPALEGSYSAALGVAAAGSGYAAYEAISFTAQSTIYIGFLFSSPNATASGYSTLAALGSWLANNAIIQLGSGVLGIYNGTTGTSGVTNLANNTTYYIKLAFSSSSVTVYSSTNGTSWTNECSSSLPISTVAAFYLGNQAGSGAQTYYFDDLRGSTTDFHY